MFRRVLAMAAVLGLPGLTWAQTGVEKLFPRGSQVYLRWDGFKAHQKSFNQSALGKMLQGETGTFLKELVEFVERQIDAFGGNIDPGIAPMVKDLHQAMVFVGRNGFNLAVEIPQPVPPEIEALVVFPGAGKDEAGVLPLIKKIADMAGADTKVEKTMGRSVSSLPIGPIQLAWWKEGPHAVVWVGTGGPEKTLKRIQNQGPDITGHPLYRELASFKEFATWGDGYVDLANLIQGVAGLSPDLAKLIDELGLKGVKSITFHSGFDGPAERGVVFINMPGPRKGLLRLAGQKPLTLADLPPLPPDLTSFSASNLDLKDTYDVVAQAIESGIKVFAPNQYDTIKDGFQMVENLIQIKLREDLFAHLGDRFVQYNSPGDGPLRLGTVYLVKVRDTKKLEKGLEKLLKPLKSIPLVSIKEKTVAGVPITEIHFNSPGFFYVPAFALHKGWLAVSFYPQPIRGFVMRMNGDIPAWKADADLAKRLQRFPKEFVSISISDPRPTVRFVLSVAPPLVALLNGVTSQFLPGVQFDASLIPNAHEATRHLFPNITVTTDDGQRVRMDSRLSLPLPY